VELERESEKTFIEESTSIDSRTAVPAATTSSGTSPVQAPLATPSRTSRKKSAWTPGECAVELLPDLDGLGYKMGVQKPLWWLATALGLPALSLLFGTNLESSDWWQSCLVVACATVVMLQVEFTFRWARALDCIHGALQLYTGSRYPIGPATAEKTGYLASPILIPFFIAAAFMLSECIQPAYLNEQVSPWMEIARSVVGLVVLLIVANASTLATFLSHVQLFGKLVNWINSKSPPENQLNPNVTYLVPVALVLPATWAIWSFPSAATAVYLVLAPLSTVYAFAKLSQVNDHLRAIMAPHTVTVKLASKKSNLDLLCVFLIVIACVATIVFYKMNELS
jgi:hypothetical protein